MIQTRRGEGRARRLPRRAGYRRVHATIVRRWSPSMRRASRLEQASEQRIGAGTIRPATDGVDSGRHDQRHACGTHNSDPCPDRWTSWWASGCAASWASDLPVRCKGFGRAHTRRPGFGTMPRHYCPENRTRKPSTELGSCRFRPPCRWRPREVHRIAGWAAHRLHTCAQRSSYGLERQVMGIGWAP